MYVPILFSFPLCFLQAKKFSKLGENPAPADKILTGGIGDGVTRLERSKLLVDVRGPERRTERRL
jgi:hypothetical protein